MKINQDYKLAYRAGYFIDKHTLRREYESASVVFFCLAACSLIILAVMLQSCANFSGTGWVR